MNKTNEPNLDLLYIGFLLAIIWMLVGCGNVICEEPFPPGQTVYVDIKMDISRDYVQKGLDFWKPYGFDYRVQQYGDPKAKVTIVRLSDEKWMTMLGETMIDLGLVELAPTAGPEVVAHEFGHISGILTHIDPVKYPDGCHLMNSTVCFPLTGLTPPDEELLRNKSWNCLPGFGK